MGGQTARKKVPVRFLNNSRLQQPQRAAAALLTYAITADVWQHATATLDSATFPEARTKPALVLQQRRSRTHASLAAPASPILLPPSPPHKKHRERDRGRHTDTEGRDRYETDQKKKNSDGLHTPLPRLHLPFVLAADQDTDRYTETFQKEIRFRWT